jgi:hypothetical protein
MKARNFGKQGTRGLLTSLFGLAASLVAVGPVFAAEDSASSGQTQSPVGKPEAAPEGTAGLRVYVDPQTGAVRRDPAPGTVPLQLTPQEQRALSTSHEGLVPVPNPVPGGGIKLDLQGRFQSPLIGTIDANGKLRMQHLDETPDAHDKK